MINLAICIPQKFCCFNMFLHIGKFFSCFFSKQNLAISKEILFTIFFHNITDFRTTRCLYSWKRIANKWFVIALSYKRQLI